MASNYSVDTDDPKLKAVDTEEAAALKTNADTYDGMIKHSESFFNSQIQASKDYADKQTQLQQEQTDFAIDKIEQQKDQTKKDYLKEQSGAYVDWQKESNAYGVNAEQMASQGMSGTGYSESSKVSMFNAYQNRVATARASYNTAIQNYNNAITEARLQNNSALAEIAYNALQKQLELSLAGFQYKNTLLTEKASKELTIKQMYDTKWQNVWNQLMEEKKLEEQARQFDAQLSEEKRQFNEQYGIGSSANITKYVSSDGTSGSKNYALSSSTSSSKLSDKSMTEIAKAKSQNQGTSVNSGSTKKALNSFQQRLASKLGVVQTEYYNGSLNADANKYGTFSNGYQPKGISGHGKLSKTGEKVHLETQTLSGKAKTVTQNLWKASDGTQWYWDGRKNKYIQIGG